MRKTLLAVTAVAMTLLSALFFSLSVNCATSEITTYSMCHTSAEFGEDGYVLPEKGKYIFSGKSDFKSITSSSKIDFVSISDGTEYLRGDIKNNTGSFSVSFAFSDNTELHGNNLGFSFCINADDREISTLSPVTAELSLECDGITYNSGAQVASSCHAEYLMDTSSVVSGLKPVRLTLKLSWDPEVLNCTDFLMSLPYTDGGYGFKLQKASSLRSLSIASGNATVTDKSITVRASNSDTVISATSLTGTAANTLSDGKTVYCIVNTSGGSGTISASSDSADTAVSPLGISEDTSTVAFRLKDTASTRTTHLTVRPSTGQDIVIDSIYYIETDETDSELKSAISSLAVSNGYVTADGKLSEKSIRDNMGAKLGLYMLEPCGGEPILLTETSLATRFSVKASLSGYPHAASENMFFIAISDRDGSLIRLSEPRYATVSSGKTIDGSYFGLHGADPVAVYESRASYVITDVDLSRLYTDASASNTTVTRGNYVFGINTEYLKELDADLVFYKSAGISVYMRLVCSSSISSRSTGECLTYDSTSSREFVFRADNREAVSTYAAIVSFLCDRYSNIVSVIPSSGLNSPSLTGIDSDDLYSYACAAAEIVHLTYSAANEKSSGVTVSVPLTSDEKENSSVVFTALLSERLSIIGQITWGLVYTVDSPVPDQSGSAAIAGAKANGSAAPTYTVFIWAPSYSSGVAKSYRELCTMCDTAQTKVVFLSLSEISDNIGHEEYRRLRLTMADDNSLMLDLTTESSDLYDIIGTYSLWDFSDAYSTLGWTAGYGISELRSVPTQLGAQNSKRALRCRTLSDGVSSAAILLCTPSASPAISASPLVEFTFSFSAADILPYTVFVFGSGNSRAEFTLDSYRKNDDGTYSTICDLSSLLKLGAVEYLGIMIYSDDPVEFEIHTIRALSKSYSSAELESFYTEKTYDAVPNTTKLLKLMLSVLAVVLVTGVSLKLAVELKRTEVANEKTQHRKNAKMSEGSL